MSFTEKKRQEIKKYILQKIAIDDEKVIEKTMDSFGISVTSVKRYLKDFTQHAWVREADDRKCGYKMETEQFEISVAVQDYLYEEDILYRNIIAPKLSGGNQQALSIWQYVCSEILNNALEHSAGTEIKIWIKTNCLYTTVVIADNGIGAFRTILSALEDRGWNKPKPEDAIVELLKGKITCAPEEHSGEGIFFSSKMADRFIMWSEGYIADWSAGKDMEVLRSHLLAYASKIGKVGTCVMMTLEHETKKNIKDLFEKYADVEQGFFKTEIPVYNACLYSQPVSRSQARRICKRLEEFKEVDMDFSGVDFMGQGFADEIFRVYASAHPDIKIVIRNASSDVARMVYHVARGKMPENVAFTS